ncbi:hypothetical protein [Rhodococcus maanshanensis]|uniref:DUF3558 domain-containing protein n=1 Tax=Rhodococcus maanshanensis TaxID=183556 RepID=A0A1H7MR47_9NOCA|nr:hypothetical protein [Rhodococcus maanshanensis]SEL13760.1 hypothetical protein SAMN05444583_106116 [Rhodococcus maanshanensis]
MGETRARVGMVAVAVTVLVSGCSTVTSGTPVAESEGSGAVVELSAGEAPDCATMAGALGPLVAGMALANQTTLPGSTDPLCLWSDGDFTGAQRNLFASVKGNGFTEAMLEASNGKTSMGVVDEPRADALNGLVIKVNDTVYTLTMAGRSVDVGSHGNQGYTESEYIDALVAVARLLTQ